MNPRIKLILIAAFSIAANSLIAADPLDKLQGQWTVKKSRDGQAYSQVIEIARDKLTFKILNSDNEVRLFAKGTVKAGKLGPFNVLNISDLEAGGSADDTKPVDDERASVYVLGDGTLTLASNLDKERENQEPTLDIYQRTAAPKAAASTSDGLEAKLVGKWNLEVNLGDSARKYELRITKAQAGLAASIISERSGERKCKTAVVKDGELLLELDREIQGNEVTFVYKGKLSDDKLAGTVAVKGQEDQFSGKWTAAK